MQQPFFQTDFFHNFYKKKQTKTVDSSIKCNLSALNNIFFKIRAMDNTCYPSLAISSSKYSLKSLLVLYFLS